jgi:molybdopterin converting factor small subunit
MRDLAEGKGMIRVSGKTVSQALANLDAIHPGVWDRLCEGKELSPSIIVMVDGEGSGMGMYTPLQEDSEVHFLPAMEGG